MGWRHADHDQHPHHQAQQLQPLQGHHRIQNSRDAAGGEPRFPERIGHPQHVLPVHQQNDDADSRALQKLTGKETHLRQKQLQQHHEEDERTQLQYRTVPGNSHRP